MAFFSKNLIKTFLIFVYVFFSSVSHGQTEDEYEFIIVGSGAGGGTLASGLAARGHTVLLLEAGIDPGLITAYSVPILGALASEDPDMSWNFHVDHYKDQADAKRDSKLMCSNSSGDLQRCTLNAGGDCECPTSHPYPEGIFYPRGSALGGSTAVNAMIYVQPKNSDWERLELITNDSSWDAYNMQQYYDLVAEKLEWGFADPQKIVDLHGPRVETIIESTVDTAPAANLPAGASALEALQQDLNQAALVDAEDGVWSTPTSITLGQRNGAREMVLEAACLHDVAAIQQYTNEELRARCEANGFLNPETNKPYLTVKTGAFVTKVLWAEEPIHIPFTDEYYCNSECRRATGVEFVDQTNVYGADRDAQDASQTPRETIHATKEVIISAGTYNTPQILMLSGVGPRDQLKQHNIPVRKHLRGVGRNLHDRYEVPVISESDSVFEAPLSCASGDPAVNQCIVDWFTGRAVSGEAEGYYTTNGLLFSLVTKSDFTQPEENLHILGGPVNFTGYYNGYGSGPQPGNLWTWLILLAHTENRGGVLTLQSDSPFDTPNIAYNYFEDGDLNTLLQGGEYNASDKDLFAMYQGVKMVREINAEAQSRGVVLNEITPGPSVDTYEEIADFTRAEAWGHHATGTAKIGRAIDPYAVLNSDLEVYGTHNLRVCDASIFPHIPGTFIASSVYTACEKLADVIASEYAQQ